MIVEIQGTFLKALEKKSGVSQSSGNTWSSQEFVITENNKPIVFEIFGEEQIQQFIASHQVGQPVSVKCAINCREWSGRYFTSLRYMQPQQQTQAVQQAPVQQQAVTQPQPQQITNQVVNNAVTDNDPLPF